MKGPRCKSRKVAARSTRTSPAKVDIELMPAAAMRVNLLGLVHTRLHFHKADAELGFASFLQVMV